MNYCSIDDNVLGTKRNEILDRKYVQQIAL